MGSRRERMEVVLCGGRPWGFSIKGGRESNKPLVVSKLEKGGKAECGGLFVGDVVYSINNVQLSGMRSEAIQFVKQSGPRLVLEVERGIHPKAMKTTAYHQAPSRQPDFSSQQYYRASQEDIRQTRERYDDSYDRGDPYERPSGREDDVFADEPAPECEPPVSEVSSRGGYLTEGARERGDYSSVARDFDAPRSDYQPSRSGEPPAAKDASEPPVQHPPVKLRERKTRASMTLDQSAAIRDPASVRRARSTVSRRISIQRARERGVRIERPRSWHASKHPDAEEAETARNMRSPTTAYHNSPAAQRRVVQQPLSVQSRRRSKGWGETGDLKSAYPVDFIGSKDSLISGGSHRSNRLSVSSSRSSGTMSSSRDSLDNLVDNGGYPQIVVSNGGRYKHHSPSKPHAGIVNQAKNLFESLSHERDSGHHAVSRSREDLERISCVRRMPSDDADHPKSPLAHQGGPNSRRSSFSPPPTDVKNASRGGRRAGAYGGEEASGGNQRDPKYRYAAARIVKTNFDERRSESRVPDPPTRDSSSVQAVKNYHHARPHSASSPEERRIYSSSPDRHAMSPPRNPPSSYRHVDTPEQSHHLPTSQAQKSAEKSQQQQPKSHGRIFAFTSDGKSRQVKAFDQEKQVEMPGSRSPPQGAAQGRYEHIKDSFSHYEPAAAPAERTDYLSRKMAAAEHQKTASYSDPVSVAAEHARGGSGESTESETSETSRGRGKYGSVWKTPQVHRRSKSSDIIANAIETWSTHDPPPGGPKLSVFRTPIETEKSPQDVSSSKTRPGRPKSGEYDSTDNQPSILRSLQKSQGNYEMLWPSSSAQKSPGSPANSALSPANTLDAKDKRRSGRDWSFNEVDLDQQSDDDDTFTQNVSYSSNIKQMQKEVLRVTSFTRHDLASPSLKSFEQKRNMFNLNQSTAQPYVIHSRSRSYGNEIDEASEPISGRSSHRSSNDSLTPSRETDKPRPKSAGVTRQRSNRHAAVQRSYVAPTHNPTSYYGRKAESLPRNVIPSFNSDDSDYQASPTRRGAQQHQTTAAQKNRRISIDVKPNVETPKSESKVDAAGLMIDFIAKKASKSVSESPSLSKGQSYTSSTSIHTSHSDESEKQRRREAKALGLYDRAAKTGSSGDLRGEGRDDSSGTPTTHHRAEHATSVRKLKNFSEVQARFQNQSRSAAIISEEPLKGRSSSLDNLVDEGIEVQSPSHPYDETDSLSSTKRDRSKSSPNIEPPSHQDEGVHAPPRRPRNRQRHSNSSSASSATTISNLSSLSSVSTTSIGKFPVLDEVNEHPGSPNLRLRSQSPAKQDDIVLTLSPIEDAIDPAQVVPPATVEPEPDPAAPPAAPKQRQAFNTNTYRVPKRDKKAKQRSSREGDGESGDDKKHVSKVELRIGSPPAAPKAAESVQKPAEARQPPQEPPKTVNDEKVNAIIEKVKRSASMKVRPSSAKTMAPPPSIEPGDGTKEQLVKRFLQRQQDLPLPPPPPPPPVPNKPPNQRALSPTSQAKLRPAEDMKDLKTVDSQADKVAAAPLIDSYRDEPDDVRAPTKAVNNNNDSSGKKTAASYENAHMNGARDKQYENVFKPVKTDEDKAKIDAAAPEKAASVDREAEDAEKAEEPKIASSPQPEISPEPLLPDVSLLPASTLQQEHPDLTRDIMKVDKRLEQMLTTKNKKTMDYMDGVLPQPSYTILQEGMRYRLNKPTKPGDDGRPAQMTTNGRPVPNDRLLVIDRDPRVYMSKFRNDIGHENLPASSTYYKTSASKAKILSMVKERMADGELVPDEDQEEINRKKMELVLSIKDKLNDLHSMKDLLDVEMRENEVLGKQVLDLTRQVCSPREQEKYNIFVQDVDHIINLLLSLSARLARVENAIQMLPADADKQEMEQLCEKRKRLAEQHVEAKTLKENIDRRQKAVSEILAGCLNHEQFADYEHYIKMKSALIMEQRELFDKSKLGEEQMQCLRDSLPDEWQAKLDKMLEEE